VAVHRYDDSTINIVMTIIITIITIKPNYFRNFQNFTWQGPHLTCNQTTEGLLDEPDTVANFHYPWVTDDV